MRMKKTAVLPLFLVLLSLALCGCKSGKKFDSAEAMISSMVGTYSASDDHSGEYVIINEENIIKFNINDIFPKTFVESFLNENFSDEKWEDFNIDVLLDKPYVKVSIKDISADVKGSTLSGMWIDKDGTLYSEKGGYPFEKISSESVFPTAEMKKEFDAFSQKLQEREIWYLINNAEKKLSEEKSTLDSRLASATETSSVKKECTASAEVIGKCAFESIKSSFRYPASAELISYSTKPQKDSYGRVITSIRCRSQNGYGNFITQDIFVLLQSCTEAGEYEYNSGSHFYIEKSGSNTELGFELLCIANNYNKDPNYNSVKDPTYLEAIELAKNGDYETAINKLETVKGYRSADAVITACNGYIRSLDYKNAVDLFAEKKYSDAKEKLAALITVDEDGNERAYSKTKRLIYLCDYLTNIDAENNAASSNDGSQNNSTGEIDSIDSDSNSTDESNSDSGNNPTGNSAGEYNSGSDNSGNNTESGNDTSDSNNPGGNTGNSGSNSGSNNPGGNTDNSGSGSNSGSNNPGGNIGNGGSGSNSESNNPGGNAGNSGSGSNSGSNNPSGNTGNSGSNFGNNNPGGNNKPVDPCANGHTWEAVNSTVHHDQEGHYERVKVEDGYTSYRCPLCYDNFKSSDSYYSHYDSIHSNVPILREQYTNETVGDQYDEVWVVDREAYDEDVIVGYECSKCGKTKQWFETRRKKNDNKGQ